MCKKIITAILCLSLICPVFAKAADTTAKAQTFPHFEFTNTELRPFHSTVANRDYLLYIGYPDSYKDHPERNYPVVYLTDAYWSFAKVHSMGSSLWNDKIAPEYILVGIGYAGENVNYGAERCYELLPSVPKDNMPMYGTVWHVGGARIFLNAIKTEIIPYVEANLHADPSFRVLMGSSYGGLFSLYAMYEEPQLFQGIVAASPSVNWDHCWIFGREDELWAKAIGNEGKGVYHMPVRLFMSVGTAEWPSYVGQIKAFDQIIQGAEYADFSYEFRLIEGERHGGSSTEAYQRGLRFVFKPMMPSPVIPNN
jgi:uncharacterized protein